MPTPGMLAPLQEDGPTERRALGRHPHPHRSSFLSRKHRTPRRWEPWVSESFGVRCGMPFAQTLLFALPVIVGGGLHIAAIRIGLWPGLARVPLDGGLTWRGRRIFGENKTVRGAVVMVAATALASGLLRLASGAHALTARGLATAATYPLA